MQGRLTAGLAATSRALPENERQKPGGEGGMRWITKPLETVSMGKSQDQRHTLVSQYTD